LTVIDCDSLLDEIGGTAARIAPLDGDVVAAFDLSVLL
jgi:hypothetical protein